MISQVNMPVTIYDALKQWQVPAKSEGVTHRGPLPTKGNWTVPEAELNS